MKSKDKKEILQIITKLKISPNRQGGLFLFLVILLILEDLEQQETFDLVQMILKNKDSSILDQEWEFFMLILSALLQKTRRLDSLKLNELIENSKNIPTYLREIGEDSTPNLERLMCFINKNSLSSHKKGSKDNLSKIRTANLDRFSKMTSRNNKILKEENLKQTKSKKKKK